MDTSARMTMSRNPVMGLRLEVLPKTVKEYRDRSKNIMNQMFTIFYIEATPWFYSQLRKSSILRTIEKSEVKKC